MLVTLQVRDLAIIDEVEVSFGGGLNVVTGETGAGKSILIDALSLVLGARASAGEVVRTGAAQAEVSPPGHLRVSGAESMKAAAPPCPATSG